MLKYNTIKEPYRSTLQIDMLCSLMRKKVDSTTMIPDLVNIVYNYTDLRKGGGILEIDNEKNSHVYIVCTAGLGNRIATLIGGLYLSNARNCTYSIVWDNSTCCMCSFETLFIQPTNIITKYNFCDQLADYLNITTHIERYNIDDFNYQVNNNKSVIVYNSAVLPKSMTPDQIANILLSIKIQPSIIHSVQNFVKQHNIDKNTTGLHIRKIDPPEQRTNRFFIPVDFYLTLVKNNPNKKYFICSDDKEIESVFSEYSNAVMYTKNKYPEYNSNVDITYRNQQSVVDALVDMLIMSRTTIFNTSIQMSSFCQVANYYSNISLK